MSYSRKYLIVSVAMIVAANFVGAMIGLWIAIIALL